LDVLHELIKHMPARDWLDAVRQSVESPTVAGIPMPGFPDESVQRENVGSAGRLALLEAERFYLHVKSASATAGIPLGHGSRLLDFGCGWGRMLRYFVRDIPDDRLWGVDVNAERVIDCIRTGVPGSVCLIQPQGRLPFDAHSFSHIIAYSVFSHLPPQLAAHWVKELARVLEPSGLLVLTVQPLRFLERLAHTPPDQAVSDWEASLIALHASQARTMLPRADVTGHALLNIHPTTNAFGTAVYTRDYVARHWSNGTRVIEYLDDRDQFAQAVVLAQKGS
jgi:SAM-dependent methyltransferase